MLYKKIFQVRHLLWKVDHDCAVFKLQSGLYCPDGCGHCCVKSDIEATILEFLPLGQKLSQSGESTYWLEKLEQLDLNGPCVFFRPTEDSAATGHCLVYRNRGLICRLFGFSVRKNKYGLRELLTCKIIKTGQSARYHIVSTEIQQWPFVPSMGQFYQQLRGIDPELGSHLYPINQAIKFALELLSLHRYFRKAS